MRQKLVMLTSEVLEGDPKRFGEAGWEEMGEGH